MCVWGGTFQVDLLFLPFLSPSLCHCLQVVQTTSFFLFHPSINPLLAFSFLLSHSLFLSLASSIISSLGKFRFHEQEIYLVPDVCTKSTQNTCLLPQARIQVTKNI